MIYDFYEFLGRGIIAERTGRPTEALKYLNIAARLEPANPRVWLWLASSAETLSQKRRYLEWALKIDPQLIVAKVLLDRLNQKETSVSQQSSDFVIFTCPSCGGQQHFDPDVFGLVCEHCAKIEPLTLKNASEAEASLETVPQPSSGNWAVIDSQAGCNACGARLSIGPDQLNHLCPFCGSELITVQPATPNVIPPTAIAPFQYHAEDVEVLLGKWWNVPPSQIKQLCDTHTLTVSPIYLPFWTFDGRAQIRCALGYRIPPAIYSPSDRVVVEGDWLENSWYECDIDDLLIYAARSVTDDALAQITPFDLKSVLGYRPEVLVGWQAEFYQLALEDAAIEAHKRMRDLAFRRAAGRQLFMVPMEMRSDDVGILVQTYKLVLLPVWIARRTAPGKIDQTLINGQTGKIAGKRQGDWIRKKLNL
jgi:predicted RNA-binding Zn-ribbon protein involved in translation (DUF1610 family)